MYGIFTYTCLMFMVTIGKYTIHRCCGSRVDSTSFHLLSFYFLVDNKCCCRLSEEHFGNGTLITQTAHRQIRFAVSQVHDLFTDPCRFVRLLGRIIFHGAGRWWKGGGKNLWVKQKVWKVCVFLCDPTAASFCRWFHTIVEFSGFVAGEVNNWVASTTFHPKIGRKLLKDGTNDVFFYVLQNSMLTWDWDLPRKLQHTPNNPPSQLRKESLHSLLVCW